MGEQKASGETEEAQTATGAVDWQWLGRRLIGPPYLHLRRHHGGQIEEDFHDLKEVEGLGQQQVRDIWANVGAFHLSAWEHVLVELWAWDQPHAAICDRSDSPWDDASRRPSHADRRKALQRHCLEQEFLQRMAGQPLAPELQEFVARVIHHAA